MLLEEQVGGVDDYKYSKTLASYGKEWTFGELKRFLNKSLPLT